MWCINHLRCQTLLKVGTDAKALFGAVSNLPPVNPFARRERVSVCRSIKPLPLPDKPITIDPSVDSKHLQLQLRPLTRATPTTRQRP